MQELIDSYHSIDKFTDFDTWIANNEKKLLEKEKDQIIDFAYGCVQHISREDIEEHFYKTYNQNK